MIPKIIHYCWYGGADLPEDFKRFIDNWIKLNPDYQLIRWDESNSPLDIPYLKRALNNKKWANASNFVRLWAVYNHGGIYMDTDIDLKKSLDTLLDNDAFFGFQIDDAKANNSFNNAFFGAQKGNVFVKKCYNALLALYDGLETAHLSSPHLTTFMLQQEGEFEYGLTEINGIRLYPKEYFYPYSWEEKFEESCVKPETIGVHFWDGSWSKKEPVKKRRWFNR